MTTTFYETDEPTKDVTKTVSNGRNSGTVNPDRPDAVLVLAQAIRTAINHMSEDEHDCKTVSNELIAALVKVGLTDVNFNEDVAGPGAESAFYKFVNDGKVTYLPQSSTLDTYLFVNARLKPDAALVDFIKTFHQSNGSSVDGVESDEGLNDALDLSEHWNNLDEVPAKRIIQAKASRLARFGIAEENLAIITSQHVVHSFKV